jgi:arsenate reductase
MNERKQTILFICTHNAARSQMAEGYLRARYGDRFEAFSAGTDPAEVHPATIAVMAELGIDISAQRSRGLAEFMGRAMDVAVTVCDTAGARCPVFPWAGETIHAVFPDPAAVEGGEEETLAAFRQVRDAIASWIDAFAGSRGEG